MATQFAIQDGGTFYVFEDETYDGEVDTKLVDIINSPYEVDDHDLFMAGKAREWFTTNFPNIPLEG